MTSLLFALCASAANLVLTAVPVQQFATSADDPMVLPTSVAVDSAGRVYVADGMNRRVVVFAADGSVQRVIVRAAGKSLSNPFAVAVDASDTLWIADPQDERIVGLPRDGASIDRRIDRLGWGHLDVTDLTVRGGRAWVVDNDGGRVLRSDLGSGTWTDVATTGLRYPFKVGLGDDGRVFVLDALNNRVMPYTAEGSPQRPIGRLGVAEGEYYRPRGIAVGSERVWVSDEALGTIQVFTESGVLEGVLRGPDGDVATLSAPVDLEVVGDHLYAVEMRAGRVVKLRVSRTGAGHPTAGTADSGLPINGCTSCHLEWARPAGPMASLVRSVGASDDVGFAASESSCLSCHDGAVRDSRRKVWSGVRHPMGEPPQSAVVPEHLPLVDGEIQCATCHTAHSRAGSGQETRSALMLRVEDERQQLCIDCHPERVDAPRGTHPMGHTGDGADVTCDGCHVTHGASGPSLLPAGQEDVACVACHENPRHLPGHGLRTSLAGVHLPNDAVLGASGELLCATCHAVHEPMGAVTCATCHPDQRTHGGPGVTCEDCHESADRFALFAANPGDPDGCLACHAEDVPQATSGHRPVGHPVDGTITGDGTPLTCASCHDSHEPKTDGACLGCHADHGERLANGGGHAALDCVECHPAHAASPWDGASLPGVNPRSRSCVSCHSDGGQAAPQVGPITHPTLSEEGTPRWEPLKTLPLFDSDGAQLPAEDGGDFVCSSCHYTHGPQGDGAGLQREGWQEACGACHGSDALQLYRDFHRPAPCAGALELPECDPGE